MRILWLAIVVVTAVPLTYVALLLNPLVYLALGPEQWHEHLVRVHPYRRAVLCVLAVCGFATAVYSLRWG